MATLPELVTKYKITEEDASVIEGFIQTEKDKGISESKKKGDEIKKHITEKNKYRDLLKEKFEIDPDGDLDGQVTATLEKLKKSSGTGKADPGSLAELEERLKKENAAQLKAIETKWQKIADDEKAAGEVLKKKVRDKTATEILSKEMGDRYHAKDAWIKSWLLEGRVKPNEEGTAVVFVDGENEIASDEWFKQFSKNNPEAVRNVQNGGSGGGGSQKVDINKNKKISQDQFNTLSLAEQKTFFAGGGKLLTE